MKPDKFTVYQLFERQERYVVPLFQRPYVWKKDEQWGPLWDDITAKATEIIERDAGQNEDIGSHFLGAAVRHELRTSGRQVRKFEIIDGQQLFTSAVDIWPRPAQQATVRLTAGQQRAIDSLCDIADQNGVGAAFRLLLEAGMRHGLYPRTEPSSILYAPQNNKNRALFTAWVTPKDGGLKVYVVTNSFPEFFKVTEEVAYQWLGNPGWRVMTPDDAHSFLQALDGLFASIGAG